ncbi:YqaA family protein [Thalassotalea agariperforans]
MKIFTSLYEWTLKWAEHKLAPKILAVLSFAESVFFPIPPDVLLAPMVLAKPEKAWRYASITTIASVIGGMLGYALGYYMFEPWIVPALESLGYTERFEKVTTWFAEWGVWVVFIAGFSPIPYKLFTVSAGFLQMLFLPFLLASAIGRGMRFFLVAGLIRWGGAPFEKKLKQWVDIIGWACVILIVVAYLLLK